MDVFNQCQLKRCETCAVYSDRSDIVTAWYSKLQTCPLVILYSISANSPSKQQGGRHIVIGAMGSVDRVITLGGVGGGVGNRRPGSYIYIYIWTFKAVQSELSTAEFNLDLGKMETSTRAAPAARALTSPHGSGNATRFSPCFTLECCLL